MDQEDEAEATASACTCGIFLTLCVTGHASTCPLATVSCQKAGIAAWKGDWWIKAKIVFFIVLCVIVTLVFVWLLTVVNTAKPASSFGYPSPASHEVQNSPYSRLMHHAPTSTAI